MTTAYLIYGYLGAGKTTHARSLEQATGAIRFTPDEWIATLYSANPPPEQFRECHQRVHQVIDPLWQRLLPAGVDVILDFGFWSRAQRDQVRAAVVAAGATPILHALSVPEPVMLQRCLARNSELNGSLIIEENTFHLLRSRFEPLGADEPAVVIAC